MEVVTVPVVSMVPKSSRLGEVPVSSTELPATVKSLSMTMWESVLEASVAMAARDLESASSLPLRRVRVLFDRSRKAGLVVRAS